MRPPRSFRTTLAALLSLSLLMAVTSVAMSAPPVADGAAPATPDEVAPGSDVRFDVSFTAVPPANYSQLLMTDENVTNGTLKDVLEQPTVDGTPRGSCSATGGELVCEFGALSSGETVELAVRYTADTAAIGSLDVTFLFKAPGASPSDKKGKSTKTDFPIVGSATINRSADFHGGYFETPTTVATSGRPSRQNPQNTSIPAFAAFQKGAIVVKEVNDNHPEAPDCPADLSCIGPQWSFMNVADGQTFSGGFTIVITLYGTYPNLNFVHIHDDHSVDRIDNTCTFTSSPDVPDVISCKTIEIGGGVTTGTLWVTENGWGKGY